MNGKPFQRTKNLRNEDYVVPFLNRISLLFLTSFNLGFFKSVSIAFKFFSVCLLLDNFGNNKSIKSMIQVVLGMLCWF